jgi:hypothetical protein
VSRDESDDQVKLWEIAENLHRAELTVFERAEYITEWVRITDLMAQPSQLGTAVLSDGRKAGPQHKQSGINKAERELGLGHNEAHRAAKITGLTPEAKKVAIEVGLSGNASALLAAKDKSGDATKEIANLRAQRARRDAVKQCKDAANPTSPTERDLCDFGGV